MLDTEFLNLVCCIFFWQAFTRLPQWLISVLSEASPPEFSAMGPTAPGNFDLCSNDVYA